MKKATKYMIIIALLSMIGSIQLRAHCQIPCGIYDDMMRIHLMEEHVTTIEKSINQIMADENQNQTVRWVLNKEKHADELSEIVTYYFMTQRIKPGCEEYDAKLSALHEILIYSMKAKQTTDLENTKKLRELIHTFEHLYIGEEHKH